MIKTIKGKDHLVIKRDGAEQKYDSSKLYNAILWCSDNNEAIAKQVLDSLDIKIYNRIPIQKLWDTVIDTAANLTSAMYPSYDDVAKRAYLLKIYKESYNVKAISDGVYPSYKSIIKKGIQAGIYRKDIQQHLSEEEIHELDQAIQKDRDLSFSFIGLVTMMEKYAFKANQSTYLELPQHVYMRVAIEPFLYDKSPNRISKIITRYNYLSTFIITEATPKMLNSLTDTPQMASCVLQTVGDSTESINSTDNALALFSKYGGGLAVDISAIRCTKSLIGKLGGRSDGAIPFIQKFEGTVSAFNQRGKRKGSSVITFPFWHYDVASLIMLKDAGGSEDSRARKLQYTIKWHKLFTERIIADEYITLFDPKETPLLLTTWGEEFKKAYLAYENKSGIRKQRIKAKDLAFLIAKVRSETGNLYVAFIDNINGQRLGEKAVFSSNLCTEITIPSEADKIIDNDIVVDYKTNETYKVTKSKIGEIGLCNLSSVNTVKWSELSDEEKAEVISNLLEASDNMIDTQFYPVSDGEYANKERRAIAIGMSNQAYYFAKHKVLWTDEKAEELQQQISEDISYFILKHSSLLAKERGTYNTFKGSKWEQGYVPFEVSSRPLKYPLKRDWNIIKQNILKYGVRFSYHMAIAPTATSGQVIQATEGAEPVKNLFEMKEGTYTLPVIVPELLKYRSFYHL